MSKPIDHLSFEQWVYFIFDHPEEGPAWYADPDAPYWNGPAALTAEYVIRLFEDPAIALEGFTDAEVNNGLWYLISPGLGEHMRCLDDPSLAIGTRVRCIRSCESLFRKLFLPRCSPHLSHRDEPGSNALNSVCYMWWDILPVYGGPRPEDRVTLHEATLDTMEAVLEMPSIACQESPLHGLGHWHSFFPQRTETLINRFLADHLHARSELLAYARSARCGCVL
jgi:hypothetical protein